MNVTYCLSFQLEVVNVRVAGDRVTSPVSLEANESTASDDGWDPRYHHNTNVDPSSPGYPSSSSVPKITLPESNGVGVGVAVGVGVGVAVGAGVGVAVGAGVGVAIDGIAVGVGVGTAVGVATGVGVGTGVGVVVGHGVYVGMGVGYGVGVGHGVNVG